MLLLIKMAENTQPAAYVRVYVLGMPPIEVPVIPETTLAQIVHYIQFTWNDDYVFVNEGGTVMPDVERNMIDYNNWYKENGYISSLYIKLKSSLSVEAYHNWH